MQLRRGSICWSVRPTGRILLQERNFNNSIQTYLAQGYSQAGAYAMTARISRCRATASIKPGLRRTIVTPAYQTLDSGFAETAAAKWMAAHAAEYGFILRYPKDKTEITRDCL